MPRRPSHLPWFVGALLGLLALVTTRTADAQAIAEAVRVTYEAPPACPDHDALLAQVEARTRRARAALPGEVAREFAVHIDERSGAYRGRLEVAASAGAPSQQREITGATCDEVLEALGFFIALTVDPNATLSAAPPPASPRPPPPPPPPTASAPAPAPTASPPIEAKPSRSRRRPARAADASLLGGGWLLTGGSGPALVGGVAPSALVGVHARVGVMRSAANRSLLSPSLSLDGVSTATGDATSSSGTLALRWRALVASACPVALRFSSIVLRPCAAVEVGLLRGDGVALRRAVHNEAAWAALGLFARAEMKLGWKLFVELDLGASTPLIRPRFRFTSGTVAYDTAAVGGRVALALTLRL